MGTVLTDAASLIGVVKTALQSLVTLWVVAIPAAMFVLGLAVKFLFGLMGKGKRRRRA